MNEILILSEAGQIRPARKEPSDACKGLNKKWGSHAVRQALAGLFLSS